MPYLFRRVAYGFFLLTAVSLLCFCSLQLAPGDYFDSLRLNPRVSPETIANFRAKSGEGVPLPVRYWRWLLSIARGDWGYSLAYDMPAAGILRARAENTLFLTGIGTVLAWAGALVLGIGSMAWKSALADWAIKLLLAASLAIPDVVVALVFVLIAVRSGFLPAGGISSAAGSAALSSRIIDRATHLFLPGLCLALGSLPVLLANVRSAVTETLEMPFVRAARGYGVPTFRLMTRHVLPAAANPLISLMGLSIGSLLSSSLVVEIVFNWPGLGQLLLESLLQRDIYLVVDTVVLSTLFFLAGNFVADVALYVCDPRIKSA